MNIQSEIYKIKMLIRSFFVESRKRFCHYGDCEIYKADRPFCNCGFLYRLNHLDYTLASIIYPQFMDEMYIQDIGEKRKKPKKETAKAIKLLEGIFGKMQKSSFEDLKMDYDEMFKILNTVFTPKMFPSGFRRLDKWLIEEVKKD